MYRLPKVHIPVWGVQVFTAHANEERADINGTINLINGCEDSKSIRVKIIIEDDKKKQVYEETKEVSLVCESKKIPFKASIFNPALWGIFQGNLYALKVELLDQDQVIQVVEEKFGIRSFEFDPDTGFWLNGENILIKGVCLHHDGGLGGAAVPLDVWRRRLETLKVCGCNAIRTAHNPVSEDFLDLCDEMVFLVRRRFLINGIILKEKRLNTTRKLWIISQGHTRSSSGIMPRKTFKIQ